MLLISVFNRFLWDHIICFQYDRNETMKEREKWEKERYRFFRPSIISNTIQRNAQRRKADKRKQNYNKKLF